MKNILSVWIRIQTKTSCKHRLTPELQNVCEISSGLGQLQQEHEENPSTQDLLLRLRYLKLFKTTAQQQTQEQNQPHVIYTLIYLAGLFRLRLGITANRDIKRTQLPPETSARFLSALFQTKHFGKMTHSLVICWMIQQGALGWIDGSYF